MMREGMEDYEYLKLLSDLGGEAEARAIATKLFPHAYETDQSADALMAARAQLAALIIERSGATMPADPGSPGDAPGDPSVPSAPGTPPPQQQPAPQLAGAGGCGSGGGLGIAAALGLSGALRLRRRRNR
jgi:uncharacterized protein (TIGR03382 family)